MNRSLIKFITDFGPLLIFFIVYYRSDKDLIVAIPPLIVATLVAIFIMYFTEKKIPYVPLLGAVLVSVFGGLTIFFKNPIFIYLKPTVINILFAIVLFVSKVFLNKEKVFSKAGYFFPVISFKLWGVLGAPGKMQRLYPRILYFCYFWRNTIIKKKSIFGITL